MFEKLGSVADKEQALLEQLKKAAQTSIKPALKEAFTDMKQVVPELVAVKWDQYTPHFNDGDVCEFNVQTPQFQVSGNVDFFSEWDKSYEKLTKKQQEVLGEFESNLNKISSMLENAFGDHATVILSAKDIEVEECVHD